MIRDLRKAHYRHLTGVFLLSLLVGGIFGYPWVFVSCVAIGYLIWILYQQHKLISWLIKGAKNSPPNAIGLWGVVFDHLYRVQKKHRRQTRQYRETIKRIRTSTQALSDGIITLDEEGNIESWNKAAVKLLKLKKVDIGHPLTNLIREPRFLQYFNNDRPTEPITIDNPAQPARFLEISMTVYGEGERLLLLRDTTRLQKLERMRQDFVANASHELKTPITVLRGHLENILDFNDDLPPGLDRALNSMALQTKRMNNLVEDLLILSRLDVDTQDAPSQPVDMHTLLEQIAQDTRELAHNNGTPHEVIVDVQTTQLLLGDVGQLRTAISNLAYNALRYSPEGGKIALIWRDSSIGGLISVTDEGMGIAQHHIPRLTERFYRVDQGRSSATGGTGLGLAIVKHILNHHNAYLDVQSTPNKGSVFTCIFPKKRLSDAPLEATG